MTPNNSFASKLVNRFKLAKGWSGAPMRMGMVMMAGALAFGVVSAFIWPENMAARITSTVILALVAVVTGVIQPIMQVSKWASKLVQQGISRVTAAINVLKGNAALVGSARKAGIIGAVIAAAVAWGFFVHSILSSGTKFGSPEFNQGLAGVIATTIVIFVLAVLAFNPVGLILAGILALVDAIFAVVCAIQGKDQSDCFSITGEVIGFVTKLVYSYDLMTEIDAKENPDLMKQGSPKVKLANPARGFVATNPISISIPVTTSIFHREPAKWHVVPLYLWFWDQDNLKENTFDYSITEDRSPLDVNTDEMRDAWQVRQAFIAPFWACRCRSAGCAEHQPGLSDAAGEHGHDQPPARLLLQQRLCHPRLRMLDDRPDHRHPGLLPAHGRWLEQQLCPRPAHGHLPRHRGGLCRPPRMPAMAVGG